MPERVGQDGFVGGPRGLWVRRIAARGCPMSEDDLVPAGEGQACCGHPVNEHNRLMGCLSGWDDEGMAKSGPGCQCDEPPDEDL